MAFCPFIANVHTMEKQNDVDEKRQVKGDFLDGLEVPGKHIQQGTARTTGIYLLRDFGLVVGHLLLLLGHNLLILLIKCRRTSAAEK